MARPSSFVTDVSRSKKTQYAAVVELVDTLDLKSSGCINRAGSIPARGTKRTSIDLGLFCLTKKHFFTKITKNSIINAHSKRKEETMNTLFKGKPFGIKFIVVKRKDGTFCLFSAQERGLSHEELANQYQAEFGDIIGRPNGGGKISIEEHDKKITIYDASVRFGLYDYDTVKALARKAMDEEGYTDWKLVIKISKL